MDDFDISWNEWKEYKRLEHKFRYKSPISERKSLKHLDTLSGGDKDKAIDIIDQSIANGWKGFFALKTETNDKPTRADKLRDFING